MELHLSHLYETDSDLVGIALTLIVLVADLAFAMPPLAFFP